MEWPEAIHEVAKTSNETERLRLVSKVSGFEKLSHLPGLKDLWCFDINAKRLEILRRCKTLERLYIDGLRTADLFVLRDLSQLEVLSLERCSQISKLDALQSNLNLKGLGIINFKNVDSISVVGKLTNIRALAIAGGMWARMKIRTLGPISELEYLTDLDLSNLKVEDESLRPLGGLENLRYLNIANFYPMEEFAWLSGKLKNAKCTWFAPYIDFKHGMCKKCGSATMVMLTGKGKPQLCKHCDDGRLAKHVHAFHKASQVY